MPPFRELEVRTSPKIAVGFFTPGRTYLRVVLGVTRMEGNGLQIKTAFKVNGRNDISELMSINVLMNLGFG